MNRKWQIYYGANDYVEMTEDMDSSMLASLGRRRRRRFLTGIVVVLLLFIRSRARGRSSVCVYRRTIPAGQVMDAMTIVGLLAGLAMFGAVFISATSPVGFTDGLFEAVSALATVGLTAGVTSQLGTASRLLIIAYMYFGRVGVLTISMGFLVGNRAQERFRYAQTNLLIG